MMRIVAGRRTGWPTRMQMAAYLVLVALMVQTMAAPAAAQQRAADLGRSQEFRFYLALARVLEDDIAAGNAEQHDERCRQHAKTKRDCHGH